MKRIFASPLFKEVFLKPPLQFKALVAFKKQRKKTDHKMSLQHKQKTERPQVWILRKYLFD